MTRTVRKATAKDLECILQLIEHGRQEMRRNGNLQQWADGQPTRQTLAQDVAIGNSYLLEEDGKPIATFAFVPGLDSTYKNIYCGAWLDEAPYYVVHRMARLPGKHHVFCDVLDYCFSRTDNIRIDTHRANTLMQHLIVKHGFRYCGIIYLSDGSERLAYQQNMASDRITKCL